MNELKQAYKILKDIPKGSDRSIYKQGAKEAFEMCNGCIEAVLLLNYFEDSIESKIDNLKKCIDYKSITKENLLRAKDELINLLIDDERYNEALSLIEEMDETYSDIKFKKMTLYAYFNDEKISNYYHDLISSAVDYGYVCLSFPYIVYLYKQNKIDELKPIFDKINDINESILKLLKGEIKQSDEQSDEIKSALDLLKNNSYLINSSPGFIEKLLSLC